MPIQLSSGDKKIFLIAAVFFTVLVILLLLVMPQNSQGRSNIPTTYSAASSGAKAGFLLLKETGYSVERWEQSPTRIQTFQNTILIIAEPVQFATKAEKEALVRFIKQGGKIIAIGQLAAMMLPVDNAAITFESETVWETFPAAAPSPITQAAPQITMAPEAYWSSSSTALALYEKDKRPVVVSYAHGKGTVIWWAAATPLTNAGLKEPGNLEFFIACLGDKATNRILWDEHFHGYGASSTGTFESSMFAVMVAQLGLVAAFVLLTFSRRSGPIRPSVREIRLSPIEFIETLGGLYEHAHAAGVAVDIHHQRFLYWLAKRLGMPVSASIEEFEVAMSSRWNFHDKEFAGILKQCSAARYFPEMAPGQALKLVRSLHSYALQLKLFPASAKEGKQWKPSRNY
jgi:hypothetical protein